MNEQSYPVGSTVTTTVHSIGGRSEVVSGQVVDHRRRSVVVQTENHGRIVVPYGKVLGLTRQRVMQLSKH